jgi:hypothetical protein
VKVAEGDVISTLENARLGYFFYVSNELKTYGLLDFSMLLEADGIARLRWAVLT